MNSCGNSPRENHPQLELSSTASREIWEFFWEFVPFPEGLPRLSCPLGCGEEGKEGKAGMGMEKSLRMRRDKGGGSLENENLLVKLPEN